MTVPVLPVSVVISSRNRPRLLTDTVDSICRGDQLPAEIVVIDQSDEPQAPGAWAGAPCEIHYLPTHARGLSRGRNTGAKTARHPLLVFVDDDMQADRQWLGSLVSALVEGGPSAVVTGRVLPGAPESAGGFVPALVEREGPAVFAGRLRIDVLAGGNMGIHRSAFMQVGGFDHRLGPGAAFPAAEDNDLGFRLLEAGHRIIYVPEAVLRHRAWRSSREYLPLRYAYGCGKGGFYVKHSHFGDLHMPRRMARDLLSRAVRAPRRVLHPRLALGELAYALGVLRGATAWALHHEKTPAALETLAHDEQ
jgi:GT2 family glycosyltransferase